MNFFLNTEFKFGELKPVFTKLTTQFAISKDVINTFKRLDSIYRTFFECNTKCCNIHVK